MDHATPIDPDTWPRREYFEHYLHRVGCTYAITVDLDVTELVAALRVSPAKTYLAQIWALATIVNRHDEFKMSLDEGDAPVLWDVVHPAFTVFNPDAETFASVWSPYEPDFGVFHRRAAQVLDRYRTATTMTPQDDLPPNTFDISSLPWTSFTGFTLGIRDGWSHLPPIVTLGRHREVAGRMLLPLALQVHHAVADGFHTARLIDDLQALVAEPGWVGGVGREADTVASEPDVRSEPGPPAP